MAENTSNKMGAVELTILTAVNMLGAGIIMLPTKLASVGTVSILSWLVTAGASTALAYAFAKCGMYSRKSGGMGGYAEYAFGKSGNFLANYTYAISLVIANVGIAISAVGYAAEFFEADLSPVMVAAWTIFTLWITTVLNFGGAKITGRIGGFTIFGVLIPVVGISIIGWFWFSGTMYVEAWNPHNLPMGEAIGSSISLTLWSFLGLESACANTDAVENPEKNVPIAVLAGTLGCALIYIASTNVMAGIVPNAELAESTAPYGLVFAYMFGETAGKVVMALMVIACVGCLLGWQFTVAQVFRTGANEGYFPQVFAEVTKKDAPIKGMLILGIIQTLLSFMTISPSLNEQFEMLVNLAVITNLVPYILSMAALDVMQRSAGVVSSKNVFIALIGSVYSLYACYQCGVEAMTYGSLVTFAGWVFYGFISKKYDLAQDTKTEA